MKGNFNTFVKNKNMKKNVDCEMYISQLVTFFEKNPNDLIDMVGDSKKESFFELIREYVYGNLEKGEEIILTNKQLIEIVLKLNETKKESKTYSYDVLVPYIKTKFGEIILN